MQGDSDHAASGAGVDGGPQADGRPRPDRAGYALEFETRLDPALIRERIQIERRRDGATAGSEALWTGLAVGLTIGGAATAAATLFEAGSSWTAEAGTAAALFLSEAGRPFLPVLGLALGFAALGFLGRWAEHVVGARAAATGRLAQELLRRPARLRLDPAGAALSGAGFEIVLAWPLVEEVRAERGAIWLCAGAEALPIPRTSVGGPVEAEALLARIEAFREAAGDAASRGEG